MADQRQSLSDLKIIRDGAPVSNTPAAAATVTDGPVEPKIDAQGRSYATGRRKNAIARVWVKPGKGKVTVNGKEIDVYFARPVLRMLVQQPLITANRATELDIECTVAGGGL